MSKVLIYKAEMSGEINENLPLSDNSQPNLTRLSCALCDKSGEAIQVFDFSVSAAVPEGINYESIDEGLALVMFTMLSKSCDKITESKNSHSAIIIAMNRYGREEEVFGLVNDFNDSHEYSEKLGNHYNIVRNVNNLLEIIESAE
tara:strand:+ start:2393 stop:2827 length:435 start_codon:yes stop_codon:yes gene_type:complete